MLTMTLPTAQRTTPYSPNPALIGGDQREISRGMSRHAQANSGVLARMISLRVLSLRRCGDRLALWALYYRTLQAWRISGVVGGVAFHNPGRTSR